MSSGVLIKTLIDLGADVNAQTAPGKKGPLLLAASSNNYVVTGLLLEHGADVNIQDNEGNSPLLLSVRQGFFSISQLLLNAGFHTKLRSKAGETLPFKLLLENKADVDIQGENGETPLDKAVTQKDVPLVKLLLENKADVDIQDENGETPLHEAVTQKDVPLVKQQWAQNKQPSDIVDPSLQLNGANTNPLELGVINSCVVSGNEMVWNTLPLDRLMAMRL
ncbi:ankyrin repeat and protein kinase domain-containing protein 1-like [Montipora capricornis]|uniref:ankyrin repeat and protein kinase domain-containing protein 1-like n=1 Tax=Montipora capricornis TaxID=246305 RepID=UPI0035F10B55